MNNTIGDLISMVSTWMIRSAVFSSALVISVELAQTCVVAVGFFSAPAVHVSSNYGASDSARTITCSGTGADRRGCMYACHTGCPYLRSDCRGSGQNRISPQSCVVSRQKRKGPRLYKNQVKPRTISISMYLIEMKCRPRLT